MATHSSILAWEMPQREEPGGPRSLGLQSRTRLSERAHTRECEHRTCTQLVTAAPFITPTKAERPNIPPQGTNKHAMVIHTTHTKKGGV